ncbi:hypothetical protein LIG30_2638 [Burkholderia sp. lig30]|uniref:hypothetical protein n=1 Tax=Burkholderia sp. lig30 TaxID=1192124 RepID=UPI0004615B75|nr:hypothetical protein [Burkholderia sp. lig30]KDB08114.1 hypothetical protein LIG30_2638 [Burkholderia sp. lig30]
MVRNTRHAAAFRASYVLVRPTLFRTQRYARQRIDADLGAIAAMRNFIGFGVENGSTRNDDTTI